MVLEHLPVIVFTVNREGRIISFASRNAGLPGREALEQALTQSPVTAERFMEALAGRLKQWREEAEGQVWELHISPEQRSDGTIIALQGVAHNITERLEASAETRWRDRKMIALNALAAEVNSSLELDNVLQTLRAQLARQLNIPGGEVYLLDFNTVSASLHSTWGSSELIVSRTTQYILALLQTPGKETSMLKTPHSLEGLTPDTSPEALWQSAFCVPLYAAEELLGVLVLHAHEPFAFVRYRLRFFEMLGRQVGTALQNARLYRCLEESSAQLRTLAHRVVEAQETERARLARDLHDEFGQVLTGLKMSLDTLERSALPPESAARRRREARELVEELIGQVRQMSVQLRPSVLDDLGLLPALRWHLRRYEEQTSIAVTLCHEGLPLESRFPPSVEIAAYRIVQEALTNVARHAETAQVWVTLSREGTDIFIEIRDAGRGVATERQSAVLSSGLSGMRERALALGGTFQFHSLPGEGTCVFARLPTAAGESGGDERR